MFNLPPGPRETAEFKRIRRLPQRDAEATGESIRYALSDMLRAPGGTMTLRPLQALALAEAVDFGGTVILLPVGQGKTLVSYLLPTVLEAERPLLLVPGKLWHKTIHEFEALAKDWKAPKNLKILTYEKLSADADILDKVAPDLIIADESHKLKNPKATCTKRVWRYWGKNRPKFVPMSGTLAKRSFFDWWHLQGMSLPSPLQPLPDDWRECQLWAQALDEKTRERVALGALEAFGGTIQQARTAYGKILKGTPGVIAADSVDVSASLTIEVSKWQIPKIDEQIRKLNGKWELPDGTEISEAADFWRHSRELANGFYYRWAEEPPAEWREKRRLFNARVREVLRHSRKYTAPAQVVEALREDGDRIVLEWFAAKDSFQPKTEAVWFHEHLLRSIACLSGSCLVWYEHKAVGEKLREQGLPTFGAQGKEITTGKHIYDYAGISAAVSVNAMCEGFNLQRWSKNIVLNCTPTGTVWEQLIGRTHRSGQEADNVEVELITTTDVQRKDFRQARRDAEYIQATTGQAQKLTVADIIGDNDGRQYAGS